MQSNKLSLGGMRKKEKYRILYFYGQKRIYLGGRSHKVTTRVQCGPGGG